MSACPETEHHVISGSYDNTVKLWDLRTSIPLATLVGHTEKVGNNFTGLAVRS